MILPFGVGIIYGEGEKWAYLIVAVICFVLGKLITIKKPANKTMYTREGFAIVALGWLVMSAFGAMPFVLAGDIPSYVDALFETISGFTTTGASALKEVESLSFTSLFWRSFTHWIGGMGVFVFIAAILPMMGSSTMHLLKAESPGPSVSRLVPHAKDTAKILYFIYIIITVVEIICLLIAGMPLFDSVVTTFGTVGTGGFGIKNDSMTSYTPIIQNIITIFMILSGVNYTAYFYLLSRKFKDAFKIEEVKWYFAIILGAAALILFDTRHIYSSIGVALRHVFFQIGSIITTTGYSTCDYDLWPQMSKTILIILMFVGACAGSTGGGIKVSRIVILLKAAGKELNSLLHPRAVKKIRMDGHSVTHEVIRSTNVFISIYFIVLFASVLLISVDELSFTTNFTAVAATLNNIGPGMELVGPTQNFSIYSVFSKCVLMFDMLAGRLELFPVLLLLYPASWRKN